MKENMIITKELYNLSRMIKKKYHQAMENYSMENHNDIITTNNAEILSYLAEKEGEDVYLKDIEKLLCVAPSTVNEIIRIMESKDLVVKTHSRNDARFRVINMTEKGRSILTEATSKVDGLDAYLTDSLSRKEVSQLKDFLFRIKERISSN